MSLEVLLRRSSTSSRIRVSVNSLKEDDINIINNDDKEEDEEIRGVPAIIIRNLPLPKRIKTYIAKTLRPNIHINIYYYSKVYNEYRLFSLLNILVEEYYYK